MIIQKLLLLIVPLLLLVEAQNNPQRAFADGITFQRPVRPGFRPVRDTQPAVSEISKPGDEFSGIVREENIPILRKSYLTESVTSETENPDRTINSEYGASGASSTPSVPSGFGQPTRKPLWSKRTSTSYFSRRLYDTPTTTITQKTIKPQDLTTQRIEPREPYTISAVTNKPFPLEIVTYQSNKQIFNKITPTPRNKPDRTFYTRNVPITVRTVATTELPESTTYTQSEFDATESSTQNDVVSNEKEIEVLTTLTQNPTKKPPNTVFATTLTTTEDPTTQSIINYTTRPITSQKAISYDAVNQLYDYTCRNVNEYYSVPNHCDEYIECENNIPEWHLCPGGLYFDSKKKWPAFPCAYPFEVQCKIESITSTSYIDVSTKGPETIKGSVAISAEVDTIKPAQTIYYYTDYSTPATAQPTRIPVWSRKTTQKSYEPESYIRTTYAIFDPQETIGSYTINGMYEPATSQSVTSELYENLPVDISSTYMQPETETPEPSTLPNETKDDVSNGTPTEVSVTYIPSQNIPDISIPNIISPSSTSRPEIIEVTNQEPVSVPNWNELPAQTTAQNNQPINQQRPTWNFPSRPSYAAQATPTTTPTTTKPITQPIIDFTTRPTVPQRPLEFYAVNQLNDYTCRDVNGYYSVSNQCDEYVECVNNKAYRNLCPDGLHFNPKANWPAYPCSYPSEVKCESQSIIQQAQPTDQCPHRYGIFPTSNGDCGHFIMCQEGLATLMPCPPGLAFNPITSTCDWLVNVPGCNLGAFRDFTCPSDDYALISHFISYYKYKNSCTQYIICQEGRPRLLSCDAGLSFDEKTNQCVNSDLIQNCQNNIYE